MAMPSTINFFHQDKWKISFSNIPSIQTFTDLPLYDLYVKSVTIPDISIALTSANFKQFQIVEPISKGNVDLANFSVTFKCDENLTNYYNLYLWMLELRYGQNLTKQKLSDNNINFINLTLLDNQKRPQTIITYSHCWLISLSSLTLDYGVSEELVFSCTFSYREINFDREIS